MDANRPKRRKSKDNPYTIFEEQGKLYVTFKDGQGIKQKIEVNNDIFNFLMIVNYMMSESSMSLIDILNIQNSQKILYIRKYYLNMFTLKIL